MIKIAYLYQQNAANPLVQSGRPASILFPPEHAVERERVLRSVLAGQVSSVHLESEDVAADGARIAVALTASPIRDASGLIVGVARITRDISERKKCARSCSANADIAAHERCGYRQTGGR